MATEDATLTSQPPPVGADRDDFAGDPPEADLADHVDDDAVLARVQLRELVLDTVCPPKEESSGKRSFSRPRTLRPAAGAVSPPRTLLSDGQRKEEAAAARAAEQAAAARAELEQWPVPAMEAYLEQLCSYSVARLVEEPDRQAAAAARTAAALEEAAVTNYRALIGAFACAGAVREGVSAVHERLDSLVAALPVLVSSARAFASAADEADRQRRACREAMGHLDRVMDVLEIPRLFLTLIQAQLYDEALELYAYVEKITARARRTVRSGRPPAVADGGGSGADAWVGLLEHVRGECQVLGARLAAEQLSVLRGPVSLPTSLRAVGFLRRLGDSAALNAPARGGAGGAGAVGGSDGLARETWLRLLFLAARGACMSSALDAASAGSGDAASATAVVRVCDQARASLFEAVTHYRAVFADDEEVPGDADKKQVPAGPPLADAIDDGDDLPADAYDFVAGEAEADLAADDAAGADVFGARVRSRAVLSDWVAGAVTDLLARVEAGLSTVSDGAAVAAAAEPAMACGQSLGRVGADVRPALAPLLTSAIGRVFLHRLDDTLRRLDIMLDGYHWVPVGGSTPAPVASAITPTAGGTANGDTALAAADTGGGTANGDAAAARAGAPDAASPPPLPDGGDHDQPPTSVLWSPPLAVYTNGLLCALNEVRQLPAAALADGIADALADALRRGGDALAASAGAAGVWLSSPDERRYWAAGAAALADVVTPHVAAAAGRIVGRPRLLDVPALRAALRATFDRVLVCRPAPPPPSPPAPLRPRSRRCTCPTGLPWRPLSALPSPFARRLPSRWWWRTTATTVPRRLRRAAWWALAASALASAAPAAAPSLAAAAAAAAPATGACCRRATAARGASSAAFTPTCGSSMRGWPTPKGRRRCVCRGRRGGGAGFLMSRGRARTGWRTRRRRRRRWWWKRRMPTMGVTTTKALATAVGDGPVTRSTWWPPTRSRTIATPAAAAARWPASMMRATPARLPAGRQSPT